MKRHPGAAEACAYLKHELSARFREDREAYTGAKTGFISGIVRCAKEREQG